MKISELKKDLKEVMCNCSHSWNIFINDEIAQFQLQSDQNEENIVFSDDIEFIQNTFNIKNFTIESSIIYEEGMPIIQTIIEINHSLKFDKE